MATVAICRGTQTFINGGGSVCDNWEILDAGGIPGAFILSDLDPVILAQAFSSGFVLFGTIWLMGWGVRVLLNLIRTG